MARRIALLIGNKIFNESDHFPTLLTPENDVRDLAEVLRTICEFEIFDQLIDKDAGNIRDAVEDLYGQVEKGDLTLLYYSGHGYKDTFGQHYLVAKNTSTKRLMNTGVHESFLHDVMRRSRTRHKIIVLDCCFSGAFIKGKKSGADSVVLEKLKGEASAILASSSNVQYSFEERERNSLFTHYVLEGINTGQADEDGDGLIDVDELFGYVDLRVRERRPEQTPMLEIIARDSKLFIGKNPKTPAPKVTLPDWIMAALNSNSLATRLSAVAELSQLVEGEDESFATVARNELERISSENPDAIVRGAAAGALGQLIKPEITKPPESISKKVEDSKLEKLPPVLTMTTPFKLELIRIPAGEFIMGSDPEERSASKEETPKHNVYVDDFYIDRFPITCSQYEVFVRNTINKPPADWYEGKLDKLRKYYPVVHVSWDDAITFCDWLREETGKSFRLPTEAEWEKAARGTEGLTFPWGNDWSRGKCNVKISSHPSHMAPGRFSPEGDSPYGVADMAGNILEWCSSLPMDYPYRVDDGRENLGFEGNRIFRGGWWNAEHQFSRCAARANGNPHFGYKNVGFRVAVSSAELGDMI